jgi:glutathione peroxidase
MKHNNLPGRTKSCFLVALLLTLIMSSTPNLNASLLDIPVIDIDGKERKLSEFKGKVLLIVNVASKCGFTGQYEGLEKLYRDHKDAGLVVLGFPCNQFFGQEPGSDAEIKSFCRSKYDVTFPMFSKVDVKGDNQHPLFAALTGKSSPLPGKVSWNFNKFVVDRSGNLSARFGSMTKPSNDGLIKALKDALAAKH